MQTLRFGFYPGRCKLVVEAFEFGYTDSGQPLEGFRILAQLGIGDHRLYPVTSRLCFCSLASISLVWTTFSYYATTLINVRPTNPSNRPVYRELDERLRELNAEREYRDIRAGQGGFEKSELQHDEAYMGVLLAADGYGSASVEGVLPNGENLIVRTEDAPVTQKVTDSDEPEYILAQLFRAFEKVWDRKRES